ncbi:MAG: hypothetical protein AB1330_01060 [Bacillota bacterium]
MPEVSTRKDSEMVWADYFFTREEAREIIDSTRFESVDDCDIICNLVSQNSDEWENCKLDQKVMWIRDELTEAYLRDYIWRNYLINFSTKYNKQFDDFIWSIQYDGPDILLTIGLMLEQGESVDDNDLKKISIKQSDGNVIYLDSYR